MIFFIFGPKLAEPSFFLVLTVLKIVSKSSTIIIDGWNSLAQMITDHMSLTNSAFSEYLYLTQSGVKSKTTEFVSVCKALILIVFPVPMAP